MRVAPSLMVGLMSGTSLDGIDAALVQVDAAGFPRLRDTLFSPYPDDLRQALLRLHVPQDNELHEAALAGNLLAHRYADAVLGLLAKSGTAASAVQAIGCHGQTVRHNPSAGYTSQLGNPALLAELTGMTVVADFRNRDIAAGGQGAPLVPACHDALFRHPTLHRVILNIGGIANLTDLAPGVPTRGFDCGTGNLLLDAWIQRHLGRSYDAGGEWAGIGHVLPSLLQQLQAHPFFHPGTTEELRARRIQPGLARQNACRLRNANRCSGYSRSTHRGNGGTSSRNMVWKDRRGLCLRRGCT
jgi:anhydro-N-acetylmuramic acid kinase